MKHFWWDKMAIEMQRRLIESDAGDKRLADTGWQEIPITGFEVKKAILHNRHDIVMVISLLSSVNLQLSWIKWLLVILILVSFFHH